MNGMTTQNRLDEICRISGLSEDIVRRVIDAERQSIVGSLRKGERATLIGRCVIRPELRSKLMVGGTQKNFIKLSAAVTSSLESYVKDLTDFEIDDGDCESVPNGILAYQIPSLV